MSQLSLASNRCEKLKWKSFNGTAKQFHDLVTDVLKHNPQDWIETKGQNRLADKIFRGHTNRTYMNVSALREYLFGGDGSDFSRLFWKRIR